MRCRCLRWRWLARTPHRRSCFPQPRASSSWPAPGSTTRPSPSMRSRRLRSPTSAPRLDGLPLAIELAAARVNGPVAAAASRPAGAAPAIADRRHARRARSSCHPARRHRLELRPPLPAGAAPLSTARRLCRTAARWRRRSGWRVEACEGRGVAPTPITPFTPARPSPTPDTLDSRFAGRPRRSEPAGAGDRPRWRRRASACWRRSASMAWNACRATRPWPSAPPMPPGSASSPNPGGAWPNTQALQEPFDRLAADDANLLAALAWLDEHGPAADFASMAASCGIYWYAVQPPARSRVLADPCPGQAGSRRPPPTAPGC